MYGELTNRDTIVACTMHRKCWSSGCAIVLLSFTVLSLWISIQCLIILQKYSLFQSSILSAHWCLQIITKLRFFTLDFDEFQTLVDLQTLTVSFGLSSDSDLQLSFPCKFFFSHFYLQNQYLVLRLISFILWSCTLEQILSYPIEHFIPCYHQNSKRHC